MLMIAQKIVAINEFNHREASRLIGIKGLRTFDAAVRRDPNNRGALDLAKISHLTGWPPGVFDASFTEFYFPASRPCHYRGQNAIPLYRQLRFCADCAAEGVHLLLHQFEDCVLCPIHRTELITSCPFCQAPIQRFSYSQLDTHPFACETCHWRPWVPDHVPCGQALEKRLQVLHGFGTWIEMIQKRIGGSHDGTFLLSAPARFQNLAQMHALIPGPDWIEDCFFENKSIGKYHYPLGCQISLPEPRQVERMQSSTCIDGEAMFKASAARYQLTQCIQALEVELSSQIDNWNEGGIGINRHPDFGLCLAHNENTSVLRTGLALWRCWANLNQLTKNGSCWQHTGGKSVNIALQRAWRAGPGLIDNCNTGQSAAIDEACERISAIWGRTIAECWLIYLVVRAGMLSTGQIDVHQDPIALGGFPVILLSTAKRMTTVSVALSVDSNPSSLALNSSLGKGFLLNAIDDPRLFDPLFKLGAVRAYDRFCCIDHAKRYKRQWAEC